MGIQTHNIIGNKWYITSGFSAILLLMATLVSSFASEICIFGKQNNLVQKNGYTGFDIPFETENAVTSRGISSFCSGQPGHPALPQQIIRLLLPIDADLSTICVVAENAVVSKLDGKWDIPPAPPCASSGTSVWPEDSNIVDGKDMDIYGVDADYPSSPITSMFTGKIGEWKLATVQICPYRYNPVTGSLSIIEHGNLEVTYKNIDAKKHIVGAKRWRDLAAESLNFDAVVDTYSLTSAAVKSTTIPSVDSGVKSSGSASIVYIIFTTSAIQTNSSYLPYFIAHKQSMGYTVRVVTEGSSQDATHYLSGSTCDQRANNMRAWLVTNHVQLGVEYVLFIGNPHPTAWNTDNSVPMKMCYPALRDNILYDCPTDMYYAELSGNWDVNSNGMYGEFAEDFDAGGIDMFCEVAVGRIPIYDTGTTQIAYFESILQKTINYERSSDRNWRKNYLGSARFQDEDFDCDGARMIERFKYNVCESNGWSHTRLYQQGTRHPDCDSEYNSDYELRGEEYGNQVNHHRYHWNNGDYGISMWWAHGRSTNTSVGATGAFDGSLYNSSFANELDNEHPSFLFPVSCKVGYPEESNNICVSVLRNGGIGSIAPSRNTWYSPNPWVTHYFFSRYSDNASYGYYIAERMIIEQEPIGIAANWVHYQGGLDWSTGTSFMNHLCFNIYGDPSVGLYTFAESSSRNTVAADFDGDGVDDIAVFDPDNGGWHIRQSSSGYLNVGWGISGDVSVASDYDGDGKDDIAIFRASDMLWAVSLSGGGSISTNFGTLGDLPHSGDYDKDGKADIAVYRPSNGHWYIKSSINEATIDRSDLIPSNLGINEIPVPADFDGDGYMDIAYYQPVDGEWNYIRSSDSVKVTQAWGTSTDVPIPIDVDGDGKDDLCVFRPSTGEWIAWGSTIGSFVQNWGAPSDTLVPGDYDGDSKDDLTVFRKDSGNWYVLSSLTSNLLSTAPITWGAINDISVPEDYDFDGIMDIATFRDSEGNWYINGSAGTNSTVNWGALGDNPVSADYDHDGKVDIAVFRPTDGNWYIRGSAGTNLTINWGASGDIPVSADYDNDGDIDIAVFRPSDATWYIRGVNTIQYGGSTDIPVPADYDSDGNVDIAVFRPSDGNWYIRGYTTINWGGPNDIPVPNLGPDKISIYRPADKKIYVRSGITLDIGNSSNVTPMAKDFDSDGTNDCSVFEWDSASWWIHRSSDSQWQEAPGVINWAWSTESQPVGGRETE